MGVHKCVGVGRNKDNAWGGGKKESQVLWLEWGCLLKDKERSVGDHVKQGEGMLDVCSQVSARLNLSTSCLSRVLCLRLD